MIYALCGFLLGIVIPYMARRYARFMPSTLAEGIYAWLRPVKSASAVIRRRHSLYLRRRQVLYYRSVMFGLITAFLFGWASVQGFIVIELFFIWTLLLLGEIDYKTQMLPDMLTIPLLIAGFLSSVLWGHWIVPAESALGAVVGYLLPVVAALFIIWKSPNAFGGGDVKLLAAIGAWLGAECVIAVILTACVLFGGYALSFRKRAGAFGPALSVAAIIVAFYVF